MIKAIFFDIDGTLVSHETKKVQESTKKAINKLREKGVKVFTCSGRHVTEFVTKLKGKEKFVRAEVMDAAGRSAYTNPIWLD